MNDLFDRKIGKNEKLNGQKKKPSGGRLYEKRHLLNFYCCT
jgi:hypothetical protein